MATDEKPQVSERVMAIMAQLSSAGGDVPITAEAVLADVGFDSLAFAEFAAALESELGIDLPDDDVCRAKTAADLLELVERSVPARSDAARPLYPPGMGRTQWLAKAIGGPVLKWWFHMEITGAERLPPTGPVVLCMNHESMLDIPLLVVASPRPVAFMAKRELFAKRKWARFFHELGGFSVDRDAFDLRAMRIAQEVIRRGEVLGMYPEGTRVAGKLLPFLPGAAWLALGSGTTLVPAAIDGTGAAMPKAEKRLIPRRVPVRISFGDPIPLQPVTDPSERKRQAVAITNQLRSAIAGMLGGS